jgi:hypothetical protein
VNTGMHVLAAVLELACERQYEMTEEKGTFNTRNSIDEIRGLQKKRLRKQFPTVAELNARCRN